MTRIQLVRLLLLGLLANRPVLAADVADAAAAGAPRYRIAPAGDWVRPVEPASVGEPDPSLAEDYLLVDNQYRLSESAHSYFRLVARPNNPSAVAAGSRLEIRFDPVEEQLTVHAVTVRRGSETIDELTRGRIEVLQREASLEHGLLDGALTFHLVMADVRVGDTIEYSYTIERRDAEWNGRHWRYFQQRWNTPVHLAHVRVVAPVGAPLNVKESAAGAARSRDGDWQLLEWTGRDVPAQLEESEAPAWFEQYPSIRVSQFASWREVADATRALYDLDAAPDEDVRALAERLKSAGADTASRTLAVVRFVQEELRYTGIELGHGAFRPASPSTVLQRRYGDCKDKALLAVTLLRAIGVNAAPALVSTRSVEHVADRLPSPGVFDHVIVRARVDGDTYWFDVTAAGQGGRLRHFAQAQFGAALVLEPGVGGLERIPLQRFDRPRLDVSSVFDLRGDSASGARLNVDTEYRDSAADHMRRELRAGTIESFGTQYLNYYKTRYPSVHSAAPLAVRDDPAANTLRLTEQYRIDTPFQPNGAGRDVFELNAEMVTDSLSKPKTSVRSTPFAQPRSIDTVERIKVQLPAHFEVEAKSKLIETPAFRYESRISRAGNDVDLEYRYETRADHVPVPEFDEFVRKRVEARSDTFYEFKRASADKGAATQGARAEKDLEAIAAVVKSEPPGKLWPRIKALVDSEGFAGLDGDRQRLGLLLAALTATRLEDFRAALEYSRRACAFGSADDSDWQLRLEAASRLGDKAEAAESLAVYAERWPDKLGDIDHRRVGIIVHRAPTAGVGRYRLLKALYAGHYTAPGFDGSGWWADLIVLQLERGEVADASATLKRVHDPFALIKIRIDNRFAPVRAEAGGALDIDAAAVRDLEAAREDVGRHRDSLEVLVKLVSALYALNRMDEMLSLIDAAVAEAKGPTAKSRYVDSGLMFAWLLDYRSRALAGLGRFDEALAARQTASHLPENGGGNVSQVINLAELYNSLARPKDALAALAGLGKGGASEYGLMQVEAARLDSALQVQDAAEAARALGYLAEHRDAAPSTYVDALVLADRTDEAAEALIARLGDVEQRDAALVAVQQFAHARRTPRQQDIDRRWEALVTRPDVQAAIGKVGAQERFSLLAEMN